MSDFLFEDLAAELKTMDVTEVRSSNSYEKLPAGDHNVEILKARWSDNDPEKAEIGLQIAAVGGDYNGASCWVNLVVKWDDKPKLVNWHRKMVKEIEVAAGINELAKIEDLVGATFGAKVEYRMDKYPQLKRIFKAVANPTTREAAAATTATPTESDNPFDRF